MKMHNAVLYADAKYSKEALKDLTGEPNLNMAQVSTVRNPSLCSRLYRASIRTGEWTQQRDIFNRLSTPTSMP